MFQSIASREIARLQRKFVFMQVLQAYNWRNSTGAQITIASDVNDSDMTKRKFASSPPLLLVLALLPVVLHCNNGQAQLRNPSLPSPAYYSGFLDFYSADYGDALKLFERGAGSALKFGPDGRFMDSACYWTMAGECHYHMGNLPEAINYYEQALELLVAHARGDWGTRIQPLPNSITASNSAVQRAAIDWHRSTRSAKVANVPNSFPVFFGRIDAARAFVEGGVFDRPEIRPVDHREIMRCVALAIYRRGQIKGPTNAIDSFTNNLLAGIARLPSETPDIGRWNLLVQGLAEMSAGRFERAVKRIKNGLQFRGNLDHDLTPIGLLALARIAMIKGEPQVASQLAMEAAYSAAVFNQYDLVEESLSLATTIHLAENKSVFAPLPRAIDWAGRNKTRQLHTSLLVQLADCQLESGDAERAAATLKSVQRSFSRTDLGRTVHGARLRYLSAVLAYMDFEDGSENLTRALEQYARHSLWRYQLGLTNNALAAGSITQRQAELVYEQLLVDPDENHWNYQPMAAMNYLTTPHTGSMEQWFEILLVRKNHEKAIEIAERIRRHRFYASLPLSGRLLALRWVASAPENLLTKNAMLHRKAIDGIYPKLRQSVNRIEDIQREIRSMPLKPDPDTPNARKQRDLFVEQLKHSRYQESVFAAMALRRQPADFVFPATVDYARLNKAMGERRVVVSSLKTGSGYHQYVMTQQTRRYLGVIRERDMRRGVSNLYKGLGISDANNAVEATVLQGKEWQAAAAELKGLIFENYSDDQWENFDELVVVPDGILWYVPFEILQTGDQADWENLHESVRIRYLPLISLISSSRLKNDPRTRVAVVAGKLHNKAEPELSAEAFEELTDTLTNATSFSRQFKIPSNLFGSVIDTLLVWADVKFEARAGAYSIQPFQLDGSRNGSSLGSWLSAPWRGPQAIVIPAFSSGAAAGLKSRSSGEEMFLLSCGFLATGAKSILISRWRAGGQSSLDLTRDYVVRIKDHAGADALFDAYAEIRKTDVDFDKEIRIKQGRKKVDSLKAEHPFFWAGNMLVDLESAALRAEDELAGEQADGEEKPNAGENDESAKVDPKTGEKSQTSTDEPMAIESEPAGSDENQEPEESTGSGTKETKEEGSSSKTGNA